MTLQNSSKRVSSNQFKLFSAPSTENAATVCTNPDGETATHKANTSEGIVFTSNLEGALYWFNAGLAVIPLQPGSKIPAVSWDAWFKNLSIQKITDYWTKHIDHELACLVGSELIVFDADSQEANNALVNIEMKNGISPEMIIKTKKGYHHYFLRPKGTCAKSDSHCTTVHPDRIDVKTGRGLATLPPSTEKTVVCFNPKHTSGLSIASQEFIDDVFIHNGRTPPARHPIVTCSDVESKPDFAHSDVKSSVLKNLVESLDPDMGYEDWTHVLMAIFHETKGNHDGLALANDWSSRGTKYAGFSLIEAKWRSFRLDVPRPVTIATIIKMANDAGADVETIMLDGEDFEPCETEIMENVATVEANIAAVPVIFGKAESQKSVDSVRSTKQIERFDPFAKFSLLGHTEELERQMVEEKPIFGDIVLQGQACVIYAPPNTGKTLIFMHLIVEAINAKKIDPAKLYYINMDDSSSGLVTKNRWADEYGFHMLADGHNGFSSSIFIETLNASIDDGTAKGLVVVLDTLKKFVNPMIKDQCRAFTKIARRFATKGGTLVALAHVNKHRSQNGKLVHSGTSDILDDFDCGYIVDELPQNDANLKVVEFINKKSRGSVVNSVAYSYDKDGSLSYNERLLSVQKVDSEQLIPIKQSAEIASDAKVIEVVKECISEGINTKMKLAAAVTLRIDQSKRAVLALIEKYTGNDASMHCWNFEVRDRGAKVFALLVGSQDLGANETKPAV